MAQPPSSKRRKETSHHGPGCRKVPHQIRALSNLNFQVLMTPHSEQIEALPHLAAAYSLTDGQSWSGQAPALSSGARINASPSGYPLCQPLLCPACSPPARMLCLKLRAIPKLAQSLLPAAGSVQKGVGPWFLGPLAPPCSRERGCLVQTHMRAPSCVPLTPPVFGRLNMWILTLLLHHHPWPIASVWTPRSHWG